MPLEILLLLIPLLIGLILLVWSSDIYIDAAAAIAVHLKVSSLIIGVVVLGFGTSLPEIIVSILASLDGKTGLANGNAIGSNIANIALVLGVSAIIVPITINSRILKREVLMLLALSIIVYLLIAFDHYLGVVDGIILLAMLVLVLIWMLKINKPAEGLNNPVVECHQREIDEKTNNSFKKSIIKLILGLVVLVTSAKLMVWAAVGIAQSFGISDLIIGLTIIAVGTSLPELASAISAARKNETNLMIGNIIGSNIFNLLAVLAMPALIHSASVDNDFINIDYPIMLGLTLLMFLFLIPRNGQCSLRRPAGLILLSSFVIYMVFIYFRAVT
jgi:cation:H+ antiporter